MSDEAKKLTAEEQAFWDAAAIAAMRSHLDAMNNNDKALKLLVESGKAGGMSARQLAVVLAADDASNLLTARRERGQQ